MGERYGLGGAGRNAAGAMPETIKIWNYIEEHPGVKREELSRIAVEQAWVGLGRAHRAYAHERQRQLKNNRGGSAIVPTVADIAQSQSDKAVRYLVRLTLTNMVRDGSLRKDDAGGYHTVRELRAGAAAAFTVGYDESVESVARMEMRRALVRYGVERIDAPHAKMPTEVRRLIRAWVEASQAVRPD